MDVSEETALELRLSVKAHLGIDRPVSLPSAQTGILISLLAHSVFGHTKNRFVMVGWILL